VRERLPLRVSRDGELGIREDVSEICALARRPPSLLPMRKSASGFPDAIC
jgi:hypothetical protein